ncbi:hypothetical protein TYRP_011140 [Tyrophagus putrescentiae]|nr:hypothetical protein TYRP_011140 [Tyrophagus putrescentiae]
MVPVFTGDPLDWPEFYSQFKVAVHNTDLEPLFKLANLREKLDEKSKHYIRNMNSASYDKALKLLEERYSAPAHIQLYIEDYVRQLPRADNNQPIAETQNAIDRRTSLAGQRLVHSAGNLLFCCCGQICGGSVVGGSLWAETEVSISAKIRCSVIVRLSVVIR